MTVDGALLEEAWNFAPSTDMFVNYADGAIPAFATHAKMLWDDTYLYIAFICDDTDVWANQTERDAALWHEEVVEVYCDPDGDGLSYLELQVNPLGTVLDLVMNKAYSAGGIADHVFDLSGLKVGISVDGSLNDLENPDKSWQCEMAIRFRSLVELAPGIAWPPQKGDAWRLNLCRYERERSGKKRTEITAWNQTNRLGFHVPEKFGRVVFR